MVRETPLDAPAPNAVATAVASALDWTISDVTSFEEGLNAVYRVDRTDGDPTVVKTATFATDAELLTEAALLERVGTETAVPLPSVHVTLEPEASSLGMAAFVMAYCEGRQVTDLLDLSPSTRSRLVAESGRHLAAIHGVRVADGFGPLGVIDGSVVPKPQYGSWGAWFDELATRAIDELRGAGFTTDDEPRFADFERAIRELLTDDAEMGGEGRESDRDVQPALVFGDYRPANLVLAPDDAADPVVRAVIDLGHGPTADGLLDLALTEDALVDVPLGGTERADRLRRRLRSAYCGERDLDRSLLDGDAYARYRLYARTRRMAAFGYWAKFAREDDPDQTAERWRSFVADRVAELD